MNESQLRDRLRKVALPSPTEAEERGWRLVRAAFEAAPAAPRRRRMPSRPIAVAVALLALAIGLSPAGAKVADLFEDVTGIGEQGARPRLTSLPAPGRLLVTTGRAAWIVSDDGSKRRLGAYREATWSPRGLFVAVTHGRSLTAVEPDGTVRWSISRGRPVGDPAWAPSGYRVAYLAGDSLHVVAGDGTEDRTLRQRVSPTPPAWLPDPSRNLLAYVDPHRVVRLIDVDSGEQLWHTGTFTGGPVRLAWSSDRRLLVFTPSLVVILNANGRALSKGGSDAKLRAAAFAPGGRRVAIVRRSPGRSRLAIAGSSLTRQDERTLYSGPGRFADVQWSPDGTRLLVTWPDADQWLFVRPDDGRVEAIANISRQFAPGARAPSGFPRVAGWCCSNDGG